MIQETLLRLQDIKQIFIDGGSYFGFPVWLQSC